MMRITRRVLLAILPILLILLGIPSLLAAEPPYRMIPSEGVSNRIQELVRQIADKCVALYSKSLNMRVDRTVMIYVYKSEVSYRQGLMDVLHDDPKSAAYTASVSAACASGINILINGQDIKAGLPKVWQVSVICHELAHVFQDLCTSQQQNLWHTWLAEGHARMLAAQAIEGLGLQPYPEYIQEQLDVLDGAKAFPLLVDLVTTPQTSDAFAKDKFGFDFMNAYLYYSVDALLAKTSLAAIASYFRASGPDDGEPPANREENFRQAFGCSVADFQQTLDQRLQELTKKKK